MIRASLLSFLLLVVAIPAGAGTVMCNYARSSNTLLGRNSAGVTFLTGMNAPGNCNLIYQNTTMDLTCITVNTAPGMYNCPGTAATGCNALLAYAPLTVMKPVACSWTCDCGGGAETFRIDNSNGLPVELLEFQIEDTSEDDSN